MKKLLCLLTVIFLLLIGTFHASAEETEITYAAVLTEARTGTVLCGENENLPLPIETQTKLMTVYLAAQAAEAGKLADPVTVTPSAEGAPGATVWLRGGEKMSVTDLLKAVIIGNANDACIALAYAVSGSEEAFVREMNSAAFSLGMRDTRFADCTGISPENTASAADLAVLCRALLQYPELTPLFTTWRDFLRGGETELVSENRLTKHYDGLRGFKAGHGDESGYTLTLCAERDGMCCIAVVLGCGDADERFDRAKTLLQTGFSDYYVTTPDFTDEFLRPVPVRRGTADAVCAEAGGLRGIAAEKGGEISSIVILPKYAEAPVRKGQCIGEIAFYSGDTLLYEAPLTAAEDVPRRGLRESLTLLLDNLFK